MFNLVPWKKKNNQDVMTLRKEFDNLFDRFFRDEFLPTTEFLDQARWMPKIDLSEGRKNITVRAEIPGADPKDLDITLNGRHLTIKGETRQEKEDKNETYHRIERSYGSFLRTAELPSEVDPEKVDAKYKNGILTIKLKKTKESEAKHIQIKAE